jgi:hypothetical protein
MSGKVRSGLVRDYKVRGQSKMRSSQAKKGRPDQGQGKVKVRQGYKVKMG